jgi:hypothetical protein
MEQQNVETIHLLHPMDISLSHSSCKRVALFPDSFLLAELLKPRQGEVILVHFYVILP